MAQILFAFVLLAGVSALSGFENNVLQNPLEVDVQNHEPMRPMTSMQAEAFGIADDIRKAIEDTLNELDDPYAISDSKRELHVNDDVKLLISSIDINLSGQTGLIINRLRVRLLIPLYPRISFRFTLPELSLNIGSLTATIISPDVYLRSSISGKLSVIGSTLEGSMTVGLITKRLTDVSIDLRIGTIQSTLVGHIGRVDITCILTDVFTDIVPQILKNNAKQINKAIEDVIMRLYKEL